ncbi:MAG: hypothetical protein J2P25_18840 [Nocardiopsaceae bacterium]|nr:hypothetical protein [Nocardiopsaceae bacterium]
MPLPRSGAIALMFTLASSACIAAAGCGGTSGTGSTGASGSPLAGESGHHVVSKAVSDATSGPSFTVSGSYYDSGKRLSLDLGYKPPGSCHGTFVLAGRSVTLTRIGAAGWVRPSASFWKALPGALGQRAASLLAGKYLKTSASDPVFGFFVKACDASQLPSTFSNLSALAKNTVTKGAVTTVDGQRALPLKDAKGDTLDVSDTSAPRILRLANPSASNGVSVTFTYRPVTVTAPPASQTVPGSKYGL